MLEKNHHGEVLILTGEERSNPDACILQGHIVMIHSQLLRLSTHVRTDMPARQSNDWGRAASSSRSKSLSKSSPKCSSSCAATSISSTLRARARTIRTFFQAKESAPLDWDLGQCHHLPPNLQSSLLMKTFFCQSHISAVTAEGGCDLFLFSGQI